MDLNYHHLYYFWVVAREGSIARACQTLYVSQPTVSAQLRALERQLGERLFQRAGRGLALTDVGRRVYEYAGEIFAIGRELVSEVRQRPTGRPLRLAVGVSDALPKLVARRILEPALRLADQPVHLLCREGPAADLLAELATHRLDVVLADGPAAAAGGSGPGGGPAVRTFDHPLGDSGVSFFAAGPLAGRLRRGFPRSLAGQPVFLPAAGTAMRRALDHWFRAAGVEPRVAGEFTDSALLKTFGQTGLAAFPAPSAVADEVCRHYRVRPIGAADGVRERFYAITVDRKLRHPAVVAVCDAARKELSRG